MTTFTAEILGTFLLILLGCGVNANVVLDKTKGNNGGWLLINFAWGLAVYAAVVVAGPYSGAHLNPAVTLGLAIAGEFDWANVGAYVLAQIIGAGLGAITVAFIFRDHFYATDDLDAKLGTFATGPAIRSSFPNFLSEFIGTMVLLLGVFYITDASFSGSGIIGLGSIGALPVALFVTVIGMSIGGTTGYAINPVRDLVPRLVHQILPLGKKRDSDWGYAWIPLFGPLSGAAAAAFLYLSIGA